MGANFCNSSNQQTFQTRRQRQFFQLYPKIYQTLNKIHLPATVVNRQLSRQYQNQGLYIGGKILIRKGYGIMLYQKQGLYYIGQWTADKRNGTGIMINSDGSYYQGDWYCDKPHGKGIYYSQDKKWILTGKWKAGEICGNGMETYPDGTVFKGTYQKNMKQDKGRFQFGQKCVFTGNFIDDRAYNRGQQKGRDYTYIGQWADSDMNGVGKVEYYEKGRKTQQYTGQFKDGKKHGYGQYTWKSGETYKGMWEQGQIKSQGVYIRKEIGSQLVM